MRVAYKIWIEKEGKAFGKGPFQLLTLVGKTGSLLQAARSLEMSYQKAWVIIRNSEKRLGFPLLERRIGGVSGGGSQLTPAGKEFIKNYGRFQKEAGKKLNSVFHKYFGRPSLASRAQAKKRSPSH